MGWGTQDNYYRAHQCAESCHKTGGLVRFLQGLLAQKAAEAIQYVQVATGPGSTCKLFHLLLYFSAAADRDTQPVCGVAFLPTDGAFHYSASRHYSHAHTEDSVSKLCDWKRDLLNDCKNGVMSHNCLEG